MGYAFISYSTKNQSSADAMRDLLNKKGIRTWMAPGDIPAGSKYAQVINRAVKECACLVLMLSDDAQNSVWVAKEVERAVNYRRPIIPVKIEDVVLNDEFELYISTDHVVAVRTIDESDKEMGNILKSVTALAGTDAFSPAPEPFPGLRTGTQGAAAPAPGPSFVSDGETVRKQQGAEKDLTLAALCIRYPGLKDIRKQAFGYLGRIYTATDAASGAQIAIKTFTLQDALTIPLFKNNDLFRTLQRIRHPNLCALLGCTLDTPASLVMEYAYGQTLDLAIKGTSLGRDIPLAKMMTGILQGLKALHDNGIYYGDLNPKNVILDRDGNVKLCDFTESNYTGAAPVDKTFIVEKYRSPERTARKPLDGRSDIYEFGVILSDFLPSVRDEAARDLLYEVTKKCTKQDRSERYRTVDEILALFEKKP